MIRRLASQLREARGLTKRRRNFDSGLLSPAFALSPSKRAKHLDASSASAEGRSKRIHATFREELQFAEPVSRDWFWLARIIVQELAILMIVRFSKPA